MKPNRSDIEFYRNMMEMLQEEKASLKAQLDAERKSREEENRQIVEENRALREELARLAEQLRERTEQDCRKDVEIRQLLDKILSLQTELGNAMAAVRLGRGKRFAPSSEKSSQMDRDRIDKRAEDKDNFDGTPPSAGADSGSSESDDTQPRVKRRKEKSAGRKAPLENYDCDEVVRHTLGEYFQLPAGATFKKRNGEVDIHEYVCYEFIPGRIVKHVWETATYQDNLGDSHNTLPVEERDNPVKGCPFSAEMLAFILIEKYAYHSPKNRIKIKLREMGARFSKSSFVRYYRLAASELRAMLADTMRKSSVEESCVMIDETCELVGVIDPDTGIQRYRKRYLWAFYNPLSRVVCYLYENGSRAREVVAGMLNDFIGTIVTDGYGAYRIFGTDEYPDILHCGCWAHVRRYVLESLGVATDVCREFLDMIQELFINEKMFKGLDSDTRRKKRMKLSRPIVNRIFDLAERIAADPVLFGRDLLRKAVNYIRNQKDSLRNFLKDGNAEISNNFCEQRMKPIKLDLKNCQNIGSEDAAEDAAFMHSLVESCRLNGRNPYDYLLFLLKSIGKPLDDLAKRAMLPDRWQPQC